MLSTAPDRKGRGGRSARTVIRYGAVLVVASLVLFELLSYFGWSQRHLWQGLSAGTKTQNDIPEEAFEDDRGCVLLDRPMTVPDFTQMQLTSWSNCKPIMTDSDWSIEHCISPLARHQTEVGDSGASESPSCLPGGYFRIQRVKSTPSTASTVGSSASATADRCSAATNYALLEDNLEDSTTILEVAVKKYLGPDTFRITLIGPERLILMQQQRLPNCTYALPYQISEPGRFTVRRIEHLYEDFDAIDEDVQQLNDDGTITKVTEPTAGQQDSGTKRKKLLAEELFDSEMSTVASYEFDVCSHCRAHRTRHGIARCSIDPKDGTKQYGTYQRISEGSYEWVSARPPCEFYPALEMFQDTDTNQESMQEEKDASSTQAKAKLQACFRNTKRKVLFTGDSHVLKLMEAVVQRMKGIQGDLVEEMEEVVMKERKKITKNGGGNDDSDDGTGDVQRSIGSWVFNYYADPLLTKTLARLDYSLGTDSEESEDEGEGMEVEDLDALDQVDTIVLGLSSLAFAKQMTVSNYIQRVKKVLDGLMDLQNTRFSVDEKANMRILWMEMPVWTEAEGTLAPPLSAPVSPSKRSIQDDVAHADAAAHWLTTRQGNDEEEGGEGDLEEDGTSDGGDDDAAGPNEGDDEKAKQQREQKGDMRSNPKIQFCNKHVDKLLDRVNAARSGDGGIDRIPAFAITAPFKATTHDGYHFTRKAVVDALAAHTIHKLAVCP